jgi:hypothetical protein
MNGRRLLAWLAGVGALGVMLLLAAALLLPRALDSHAVRENVRAFLLSRTDGNVTLDQIDLTWLPRPVVTARGVSFSLGHHVTGKIQSVAVKPSLAGLLRGRLDVSRIEAAGPVVSVTLPEAADGPLDLGTLEARVRTLLGGLAARARGTTIAFTSGTVEVKIGDRLPLVVTDLDGRLLAPPGQVDVRVSCRSAAFDSLRMEATLAGETLATTGRVRIEHLRLPGALAWLSPRLLPYVESGDLSLDGKLASVGLHKIQADIGGAISALTLVRGTRKAVIQGGTLDAVVRRDQGTTHVVVERLDVRSPRLAISGELTVDEAASLLTSQLAARNVDVARVRAAALEIAGDVPFVDEIFRYFKSGQMAELRVQGTGHSWADMGRSLGFTATLRDGSILLPGLDIALTDASGLLTLASGLLEAKEFSARSGKIQGTQGTLRLGLEGESAPFYLDTALEADAAELHAMLLRVVNDDRLRRTLSSLRQIDGRLSGRLVVGDRIDALRPTIVITKAALKAAYDPIPYPISIGAGSFQYGDGRVVVTDVRGAVGLSSFSGLTGSLSHRGSPWITIDSGTFALDAVQAQDLMSRLDGLPPGWRSVDVHRGRLDVASLSLDGSLDDPGSWSFKATGRLNNLAVEHAGLPGVVTVTGGSLLAAPGRLVVSQAKVSVLDAALTVDGTVESGRDTPLRVEATGTGSIDAQMTAWLQHQLGLPAGFALRSPVRVSRGRVRWQGGGDVAVQGSLRVGSGPGLDIDLVRSRGALEVKEVVVTDGDQRARLTLDLDAAKSAFSFAGTLEQATLNRIFQASPLSGGRIDGDLQVTAFNTPPLRFHARGRLSGRGLPLPLGGESVLVDSFDLDADQDRIAVRSADLRWRSSRLAVKGRVEAEATTLRLDLGIAADRVVWEELRDFLGGGHRGSNDGVGVSLPPVEGVIRLQADQFAFAGFTWRPLRAVTSVSPRGARTEIERGAVCGITTVGNIDVIDDVAKLDLSLSATDGDLQSTTLCLTKNRYAISGRYSLQARVAGQGTRETVAQALNGTFELRARDGQFVQSPTVDSVLERTFDYLNHTGDFDVAFPDLHRESFPFQSIGSRGRLEGLTVVMDEVTIQSLLFTLGGNGRVDFANNTIDARGLVSVRTPGNTITGRIPVVGSILDGSILGIPVRVTGSLESPDVTYLAPADVGAELLNVPIRVLGLPLEAIHLFTPGRRR